MPLRLKFAIRLTLLCSLAIILFSSCGYDGCADVPVLTLDFPHERICRRPGLYSALDWQTLSLGHGFFLRRNRACQHDRQCDDNNRDRRHHLHIDTGYDRHLGDGHSRRKQPERSLRWRPVGQTNVHNPVIETCA